MIIGLLDVRWETRHGCSLGLMGVLHGLGLGGFPDPQNIGTFSNSFDSLGTLGSSEKVGSNCSENVACFEGVEVEVEFSQQNESTDGNILPSQDVTPISEQTSSVQQVLTTPKEALTLPQYLVEDIVCTGLCLLVLDRFIDWRGSSSVTMSPAKEVMAYVCTFLRFYVLFCFVLFCLSVCLPACLSVCLSICLSVCLFMSAS